VEERWFLKIDGIEGDSTHVDHTNEIDVRSWSWGVNQTATSSGSGAGAGKASFQDFHFVSRISKASPALFLACASGSHLKSATLSGVRGAVGIKGGGDAEFLKIKMTDLLITSQLLGDSPDTDPSDQISFNFGRFELSYTPLSSAGSPLSPVTAGWDVKLNKKI
jgi:type VI secretion system secreted protein Hcp